MTKLAAAIMVESLDSALAQAATAAEQGADLVEYRVDNFTDDVKQVERLVAESPLPCIVTCRPTWEGGEYDGDDQTRIALFEHAGLQQPAYIDVELAAYQRSANLRQKVHLVVDHPEQTRSTDTGLILSTHDFNRRPPDLLQKVADMAAAPACRIIKVAWHARSLRDNLQAFELLRDRYKPTIALCMGEFGQPSRVLAKKFGALLTFAGLTDETVTAPGQVGVGKLKRLYRWDAIDAETRVFGVVGWPVGHSMSPAIHNAGFDAVDYNGVYLPMPIPPEYEHFKATIGDWLDFAPLDFRGASVTIPHKQNLLRFVRESGGRIEPLAEAIGAANTLTRSKAGSLYASNTDYAAALDSVCHAMDLSRQGLRGVRVAVIGAGGAARAIVAGFAGHGANVTIHNRTLVNAEKLAVEFSRREDADGRTYGPVDAAGLDELAAASPQVVINCTPLGMHPETDATPAAEIPESWGEQTVVFDTIYNPVETRLLREAKAAGCRTVSGVEMFVRQGAAQFELWTRRPAPMDVFRSVLLEQLGSKT